MVLNSYQTRMNDRELLEKFARWLEKHGYVDSDWYTEEPNAIEAFLKEHAKD